MGLTNAELGLVLTTVAGSATALGAAVVFSERLVQLASKPFLAGALGLSSGVAAEWRASSSSLRSTTATTALGGRSARGMRASASLPVLGRGSRSGSGSSAKPTTPQSIEPAVHAAQLKWMNKQERAISSRDVD